MQDRNSAHKQMLGQYELRELLGEGGMGAVYRAWQVTLKREVAVKVLPANLAATPGYIERFNREAEVVASLEHAHIVPVYDYGTEGKTTYIVMRLLNGGSLSERVRQHQERGHKFLALGEVADILKQLASALDYAHSRGVIHRDIKPGNIMFDTQGSAYLTDFGIARLVEATTQLTSTGATVGTPLYMSPEQWRAEKLTPATDQYSLAVMIYQLATGHMPFQADTPYGLMHKHVNEPPTPLQTYRSDVPEAVTQVLARALAKDPDDRFPTVTAFAQAFSSAVAGVDDEATQFTSFKLTRNRADPALPFSTKRAVPEPSAKPFYRSPIVWAGAVIALLLVVFIVVLVNQGQRGEAAGDTTATGTPQTEVAAAPTDSGAILATEEATSAALAQVSTETATVTSAPTEALPTETDSPTATLTPQPTNTSAPTATDTPEPSPIPATTLFSDDFSNNNADWWLGCDSNCISAVEDDAYVMEFSPSSMYETWIVAPGSTDWSRAPRFDQAYIVEVDIEGECSDVCAVGVGFNITQGYSGGLVVLYDPVIGYWSLVERFGSINQQVLAEGFTPYGIDMFDGETHRFSLHLASGALVLYIDDQTIAEATGDWELDGTIALAIQRSSRASLQVQFDNLQVLSNDAFN